jgi:hypothetical protein
MILLIGDFLNADPLQFSKIAGSGGAFFQLNRYDGPDGISMHLQELGNILNRHSLA